MIASIFFVISLSKILPPIGNTYLTSIYIPILGKQNIKYERTNNLISQITLSGKVNKKGYVYFDVNNPDKYTLDDTLNNILIKYKCSLTQPIYNNIEDIITFYIKINLINYSKKLILTNNECL